MDPTTQPAIEIRSSARRRKTGVAFWEAGRVVVVVPERMSRASRENFAHELAAQLLSRSGRRHASDVGLADRAAVLGDRYLDGVRPASIRWSARQQRRWGSCSLHSREIRIAARLQTVPEWVLDGVIVHELSHLLEAGHTPRFHELANRYPRQAEAHTYLEGFGHGLTTAGFPVEVSPDAPSPEDRAAPNGDPGTIDEVAAARWRDDAGTDGARDREPKHEEDVAACRWQQSHLPLTP